MILCYVTLVVSICLCIYLFIMLLNVFLHCLTVMFNFILHDQRKGPIWNIIMWTSLFLGQGVIICLYSHEWYAQRYCPLKEVICSKLLCLGVFCSLWIQCNLCVS